MTARGGASRYDVGSLHCEHSAYAPSQDIHNVTMSATFFSLQAPAIQGAKIFVDGALTTETGSDGSFQLFNISTGTYQIQVTTCLLYLHYCCHPLPSLIPPSSSFPSSPPLPLLPLLQAEATNFQFSPLRLQLSPATAQVPAIFPEK